MRILVAILIVFTTLFNPDTSIAKAEYTPDFNVIIESYIVIATKSIKAICDDGNTQQIFYRIENQKNHLDITLTASGETFIRYYEFFTNPRVIHHLWATANSYDSLSEITEEEWTEKLRTIAPNFYDFIKGNAGWDCYLIQEAPTPKENS